MFDGLYRWTISLAESPRATWALAAVAFAESSFFPLPPDIILAPMVVAKPNRAFYYAAVCTIASVLGGILGYAIGALLYDTVGQWLINLYGYGEKLEALRVFYAQWGWAFIPRRGFQVNKHQCAVVNCSPRVEEAANGLAKRADYTGHERQGFRAHLIR